MENQETRGSPERRPANEAELAELFDRCRERLRGMVALRLDRRLARRVDAEDVLQEAFLDAVAKLPRYLEKTDLPPYLWLRLVVGEKLTQLHRHHLGVKMRDAGREIVLFQGAMPEASSAVLAARLVGTLTSPSRAAMRAEAKRQIEEALNQLEPIDREILVLRNFELLSNADVARTLNISQQAASNRYVRALRRMKHVLRSLQGEAD